MKGKEITSNALAIQLDAQGKVKYDLIARQGHSKDKVSFSLSVIIFKHIPFLYVKFTISIFDFFLIDCV